MATGMQDLLSKFRAIRGVGMAAVVGSDGLVIESVHRPELDADALAAVATNGLLLAEALVVGILLLALTGIGWIVIQIGLRPLEHMERVAGEIADGDLSRRVTPATPRTEVGRLGLTLNKMLARIEELLED